MTAPRRSGADQANFRGIIVLFVAVVVGIALLSRADQIVGSAEASGSRPAATTTTSAPASTSTPLSSVVTPNTGNTTPVEAHVPADVRVLVVNASGGKAGVASKNGGLLTAAGYNVVDQKNGNAVDATTVYFVPGFQADAEAVKAAVKIPDAVVAPAPKAPLVPGAAAADVTVVFGRDYKG